MSFMTVFLMLSPALICGLLASVCAGALGPLISVRRLGGMAGSLSHAVLGGVGIAVWLNSLFDHTVLSPLYGAFLVALGCAVILSYIEHTSSQHADAATAAIWAIGMSIGILFLTSTPGYQAELGNYLFGSLLWIASGAIWPMLLLTVILLGLIAINYRKLEAFCFSEEYAHLQGLPTIRISLLIHLLIAVTVVMLLKVLGSVLLIAFLCLPGSIALGYAKNLRQGMVLSISISLLLFCAGFSCSLYFNLPPGATISLLSGIGYLVAFRKGKA